MSRWLWALALLLAACAASSSPVESSTTSVATSATAAQATDPSIDPSIDASIDPTSSSTSSSTTSTTTTVLSSAPTSACGTSTGEWVSGELGGRDYQLILPAGVSRPPVILEFHGFSNSASEQAERSRLGERAVMDGFGVLVLDGSGADDEPKRWALGPAGPDVDFVETLVPQLLPCVDDFFVTGFSNGAAFAVILACRNNLPVRALAPVAYATGPCPDGRSVPIVSFHGTADGTVPYDGSGEEVLRTLLGLGSGPAESVMEEWAGAHGCAGVVEILVAFDVDQLSWFGCGAETAFYRIDNGGHSWPGSGEPVRFGVTTDSISASELIVEFFAEVLT